MIHATDNYTIAPNQYSVSPNHYTATPNHYVGWPSCSDCCKHISECGILFVRSLPGFLDEYVCAQCREDLAGR